MENKNPETVEVSGFLRSRLSFAELGCASCGFETVLLAFLHSGVTGEEAGGLQGGAIALIHAQQGAGDAVTDGAGLSGDAAAADGGFDVHLADQTNGVQRLTDDELQGLKTEVIVDVAAVNGDGAGSAGEEMYAGHGRFSAAGAVHISLFALISSHLLFPP